MEEKEVNTVAEPEEFVLLVTLDGKECRLTAEKAGELAKKGVSFDIIKEDYERLKELALADGHSVGEYITLIEAQRLEKRREELLQKCGGDIGLVEHVMELESREKTPFDYGFSKVREFFPQIGSIEELPQEVVSRSRLKGSALLDELLRYRYIKEREQSSLKKAQKSALDSSVGSQREYVTGDYDPAKLQFIKGIWGK